ncbi:HD-GYP domain-containing protein [Deinococcus maricopensis]|uniref:Metal dependent phosphohydrolase n=1 Tax=Deinococcus maricopensis (strain DSM 21211 / LMG 22137 / NRRL B-23946 / LB-34) TaxID=709986 RepID=E8U7K7_DEIML|nr:HD-GYP domain-containing protein [Deinococcus maricopensis]ADV67046.1 metal dependent phosphohydrolase [Deinococcus maricopensis DSM 21211]
MLTGRAPALSPDERNHQSRVAGLALQIGVALGLNEWDLGVVEAGARLHDTGKGAIPRAIREKPGPLTPDEWTTMREHPQLGAHLLFEAGAHPEEVDIVLHHHERWDGEGYPHGLCGEAIPLGARVVAVADTFDALTSARAYRAASPPAHAARVIRAERGRQFDPRVADAFLNLVLPTLDPA